MEIYAYLIVTPKFRGNYSKSLNGAELKLVKKIDGTSMASNAVPIKLMIDLPDEIFLKPQLQAKIKIGKDQVSPPVIDAEVIENISATINKQLGFDMTISLVTSAE